MVFLSERSSPGRADHPAAAAAVPAARSPGLEPRAEALAVRRLAGGGGERGGGERQREEGDGARDPNPQPRSQRSLPGAGPALVSARCCRRRRYCSPPGCSQQPHHSRRRRTAKPLSRRPPRFSLAVSSSQTASEKGEGERSLGVRADSRSRSAARGERGRAGRGLWERRGELEGAPGAGPGSGTNFRARVFPHQSLGARG